MKDSSDTPESFFNNRQKNGYQNDKGEALWGSFTNIQAYSLSAMKEQLDLGKPVIVTGMNGSTPHYVLVVAYTFCGASNHNYVVIDPLKSADFPTTLADFKKRFPSSLTNSGIKNPMFTYF